ncbi:MAG TPA: response regulator [Pyrinomonadaceae bacterium]|nr:response regulator [Pyrinomonadaceae bacterium]
MEIRQFSPTMEYVVMDSDNGSAPPTIMVVEDFEDNRFMMRRLLEMSGYRVLEAVNGEEAVELAHRERPQLILMDLSLPQLDGLAATRRIRQYLDMKDVPIVAVSAHDTADFHADALAAGCNDYVTKPIDFDQLEALLSRLLPKKSGQ